MAVVAPASPIFEDARLRSIDNRRRHIRGDLVHTVFHDFAVYDGQDYYLPRNQLVPALQTLGLNPTSGAVGKVLPRRKDLRVSFDGFSDCYDALKPVSQHGRHDLIRAFQLFDVQRTGRVTRQEFAQVLRSGAGPAARLDAPALLHEADPHHTGWVDYIAFTNFLCPPGLESHGSMGRIRVPPRTPVLPQDPPTVSAEEGPRTAHVTARDRALRKIMDQLLDDAEAMQKTRESERMKVGRWIHALESARFDTYVREADLRKSREVQSEENVQKEAALSELKARLHRAQEALQRCESEQEELREGWQRMRRQADRQYSALPEKYNAVTFDSIRQQLHILQSCRHRILLDSWAPITDSPAAKAAFRRGCSGDLDTQYRGSQPARQPRGARDEAIAFSIGSYIHHGTSDVHGTSPLCLLPPSMLKQHGDTVAARMLTVPCELDDLGCPLDDDSMQARACRAAFSDGVNGRECDFEELCCWSPDATHARLHACYRRGLWYFHESNTSETPPAPATTAGAPRFILTDWEEYLALSEAVAEDVQRAGVVVQFLEEEDVEFDELEADAEEGAAHIHDDWRGQLDQMLIHHRTQVAVCVLSTAMRIPGRSYEPSSGRRSLPSPHPSLPSSPSAYTRDGVKLSSAKGGGMGSEERPEPAQKGQGRASVGSKEGSGGSKSSSSSSAS